jgi:hypothetical protein
MEEKYMKTYLFETQLFHAKGIQREIEVLEDLSLYQLARAIIKAYNFDFDHAFGFFRKVTGGWDFNDVEKYELFADLKDEMIEPSDAGSVKNTKVHDVWKNPKDQMLFLFDYGDEWRWIITLRSFGEKQTNIKYPHVLTAKGNAPEQYPDYNE